MSGANGNVENVESAAEMGHGAYGPLACAIARAITAQLDLNELCHILAEHLQPHIPFERLGVAVVDRRDPDMSQVVALVTDLETRQSVGDRRPVAGSDLEWVMAERRHHLACDLVEDSRFAADEFLLAEGFRSALRLPLFSGGEVIGILFLNSKSPGAYGESELTLLELIADFVAIAVKNAQLYEESVRRAAELTALHETALDVVTRLDLPTMLQAVVERAARLLHVPRGCLYLVDVNSNLLELVAGHSLCGTGCVETRLKIGEGLAGQVTLTGKPLIVDDRGNQVGQSSLCKYMPAATAVGVPLKWQEEVIGVISLIDDSERRRFSPEDVRLLEAFADQVAIAVANAWLHQESWQRLTETEQINRWLYALQDITATAQDIFELPEVLERIVWGVVRGLDYNAALLATFDIRSRALQPQAVAAVPEVIKGVEKILGLKVVGETFYLNDPHNMVARAMREGEMLVTDSLQDLCKPWLSAEAAEQLQDFLGLSSFATIPLLARGQLVGTIFAASEAEKLSERELWLLQAFAGQAAMVVENVLLFDKLSRWNIRLEEMVANRTRELAALNTLATAAASSLDLDEILDLAVEQVARALHVQGVGVYLTDESDESRFWRLRAYYGLSPEFLQEVAVWPRDEWSLKAVVESERPFTVSEPLDAEPQLLSAEAKREGYQSWAAVPLYGRGEQPGVLVVADGALDRFQDQELELLQTVGQQLGQAIKNASLYRSVEAERAYRESVINSMSGGLVVVDLQGVQSDVNPAFCAMTGFSREELIGKKPPFPYWPTEEAGVIGAAMQGEGREPGVSLEVNLQRRSGEIFPALLTISPLCDASGQRQGYLMVVRDLTEIKLMQQQMIRSVKLASLGRLAAGVAHEVNTPLSTVLICTQLALDHLTPEQMDGQLGKCLRTIEEEVQRAAGITGDLLTFARHREPHFTRVELAETLRRVGTVARPSLTMAQIDLTLDIAGDLPYLRADSQQLEQLFFNLIFNARDAMAEGAGQVYICAFAEGGWVQVIVADTGPGIPPEITPHLFDPFFTTKEVGKGTGLGLSIALGIVESHGGSITVESPFHEATDVTCGRMASTEYGTAFIIRLPAAPG
jgi:two-component system NtrC family sensor kinase